MFLLDNFAICIFRKTITSVLKWMMLPRKRVMTMERYLVVYSVLHYRFISNLLSLVQMVALG